MQREIKRMIRGANKFCVRLWRDESGVVLAITVVIFLTLFMIASGVYAIGEVVRERIEIQNAADSAAYSAAVVQADAISRIAAINRAMAWTYGQMVRMELDYVVDKWLELAVRKFWQDYNWKARSYNYSGTCNWGDPTFFWAGINQGENKKILLNGRHHESVIGIEMARAAASGSFPGKSHYALAPRISDCRTNIKDMNRAEKDIIGLFPKKITKVVEDVLSANIRDLDNDRVSPAGSADLKYKLLPEENAHEKYFEIENDEEKFLWLIDWRRRDLGHGTESGSWFELKPGDGIKRGYKRRHRILRAEWAWWTSRWQLTKAGCVPAGTRAGSRYGAGVKAIMGDDGAIYSENNYNTELAKPRKLTEKYFKKDGTIVVGVARRMNNPLQFVVSGRAPGDRGIFSMATLDADKRFMWGASSARASYKLRNSSRDKKGWFETTFWNIPPQDKKFWNLKWSDWDAVLLPLRRAWTGGNDGSWNGATTGGEILADLGGGGWKPVPPNGSGGDLGVQKAPSLMTGGNINYGGSEKLILH